jgi:predicted ATP-grasp superfamily ATP-dependent carboligase
MNPPHQVLIVGATARAAATSALRAGLRPRSLDHFADRDLVAVCPADRVSVQAGAAGLERTARGLPSSPWIYTGPLENYPERVERISRTHRLWGNPAGTLRAVRDPFRVVETLVRYGLTCAPVRPGRDGLPLDRTWLVKPLASGGGREIRFLDPQTTELGKPYYFQQFIAGPCFSALFIATGGHANLVGVTRQLLGAPGSPFAYRGSLGPCAVSGRLSARVLHLGRILAAAFGLVGIFGVDYVLQDHEPWLVEVNPRYTASVEVLELALGRSLLVDHQSACETKGDETARFTDPDLRGATPRVVGKAILYADRNLAAPYIETACYREADPFAIPALADVPWPGAPIGAGEPIMSVFATGADARTCQRRLEERQVFWTTYISR